MYSPLRYKVPKRGGAPVYMRAMADTSSQSCIMTMAEVTKMGLKLEDLTPTNYKMQSINQQPV
jgi:hypothetical protein